MSIGISATISSYYFKVLFCQVTDSETIHSALLHQFTRMLFKTLVMYLFLLSLCILSCYSKNKKITSGKSTQAMFIHAGQLNLEEISDKQDATGDIPSFLYLSDANFTKHIIERPRLFHSLILFTATESKFKCSACKSASALFHASYSYYIQLYDVTELVIHFNDSAEVVRFETTEVGQDKDKMTAARALQPHLMRKKYDDVLYVFVVDIDSGRDSFALFGVDAVPKAYLLPPSTVSSASPAPGSTQQQLMRHRLFSDKDPVVYEITQQELMLDQVQFLALLSNRSGLSIHATMQPVVILVPLVAIAIVLAFVSSLNMHCKFNLLHNKYTSCVLSVIAFGVGVSGSIFCYIRRSPWVGTTLAPVTGAITAVKVFAEQDRHQFLLEGVIVTGLIIVCASSLFLIIYYFVIIDTNTRSNYKNKIVVAGNKSVKEGPEMRSLTDTIVDTGYSIITHVALLALLSIVIVCVLTLLRLYTDKTDWYRLKEALPSPVWSYFATKVMKSSGLVKRLCRLVYIWVYELHVHDISSLHSFVTNKWHPLITDYIKRQLSDS